MFKNLGVIHSTIAEANSFLGSANTLTFCLEDCSIRFHDGCTCGGKIINENFDPTELLARLDALEALNPVVDTEVVAGTSDILVTYLDGTTETLDLPEFSASTAADGLITFDLNGTPFGPFDTGAHTVDTDTDTFSEPVDNGDGTVTVTYANGNTHTYATGPHTVDTDTVITYAFVTNPDGSITVTGSDGSTFTGPAATVDTDTDTFATLAGQVITFANGDTLTVNSTDRFLSIVDRPCDFDLVVDGVVLATLTKREEDQVVASTGIAGGTYGGISFPAGAANGDFIEDTPYRIEFTNPSDCRPAVLSVQVGMSIEYTNANDWSTAASFRSNTSQNPNAGQQLLSPKRTLADLGRLVNDRTELHRTHFVEVTLPPNGTYWLEYYPRIVAVTVGAGPVTQILNGSVNHNATITLK